MSLGSSLSKKKLVNDSRRSSGPSGDGDDVVLTARFRSLNNYTALILVVSCAAFDNSILSTTISRMTNYHNTLNDVGWAVEPRHRTVFGISVTRLPLLLGTALQSLLASVFCEPAIDMHAILAHMV